MPKTRKIRRSGRGRTRKVKKSSAIIPTRSTTVNVNRALAPIAQRYITKMKYAQAFTLPGATGLRSYRWRLNSINDPDAVNTNAPPNNNGAHRPNGYAPLFGNAPGGANPNGLYNRYRVISCKYIITCTNDNFNIQYGVLPTNDASPPMTTMSEVRENPRVKYRLQNVGGALKKLTGTVYLPSLMGRTASQYMADDSYGAVATFNPTEFAFLDLYIQGINDDTGSVMQHSVNIMLIYTVECYDLRTQDQAPPPEAPAQ